jgi:molybdopterin-containing oxidoreductase family membrane subunit
MEITFSKIEGKSSQYYATLVILAAIVAIGGYAFLVQYQKGHIVTGMSQRVPWGLPISMVVFLIGASAGSLILSSLSTVFGKEEYKVFSRVAAYLAALLLLGALMVIGLDLGRPERAVLLFRFFNLKSIFAINAFLYTSYLVVCGVYLWAMFEKRYRLVFALGALAVVWAVAVHSGTGAILGFIYGRELYHSPLMPPLFLVAALVSGTALVIVLLIGTFKYTRRPMEERLIWGLGKLLSAFILVELYFVIVENTTRGYSPAVSEHLHFLLFSGGYAYAPLFWIFQILLGAIVPLAILLNPGTNKSVRWITGASALAVFGVVVERYNLVVPALAFPQEYLPGKVVSSAALDGVIASYSISGVELAITAGVLAFLGLLYGIGLKVFNLLPVEKVVVEEKVPEVEVPKPPVPAKPSKCGLCEATFKSMDECCEHAEKEHKITKASCDMVCEEIK